MKTLQAKMSVDQIIRICNYNIEVAEKAGDKKAIIKFSVIKEQASKDTE